MKGWLSKPGAGWWRSEHGVRGGYKVALVLILSFLIIPCLIAIPFGLVFDVLVKFLPLHINADVNLTSHLPKALSKTQFDSQMNYLIHALKDFLASILMFVCVMLSLLIMSRLEGRSIWSYFFNRRGGFKFALIGFACPFVVLSPVVVLIIKSHHANDIIYFVSVFTIFLTCAIIGFQEEFLFRGYIQKNLMYSIGFFPALVVSSLLFGLAHVPNLSYAAIMHQPLETFGYGFEHFCTGVLLCVGLRQTGTLWWPIGFHAAWDFILAWFKPSALLKTHLVSSAHHGFEIIFLFGVFQLILAGLFFIVKRAPRESLGLTAS